MAPRVSWAVATQADRRQTRINDKKTFRFTFTPLTRPRDRPHRIGLLVSPVKRPRDRPHKTGLLVSPVMRLRDRPHKIVLLVSPVKRPRDRPHTNGISVRIAVTRSWPMLIIHRFGNFELIIFNTQVTFFVRGPSSPLQGAVIALPGKSKTGKSRLFNAFHNRVFGFYALVCPVSLSHRPSASRSAPPGRRSAVPCSRTVAWPDGSRPASASSAARAGSARPRSSPTVAASSSTTSSRSSSAEPGPMATPAKGSPGYRPSHSVKAALRWNGSDGN
jgi:hypothetical protein